MGPDTLSSDFPAPGAVGEEDGRTGTTWLLLATLLPGAVGGGAAGLSGGWALWAEAAPRLGTRFLRAGRMVPATLCTGVDRRAEMGKVGEETLGRTGPGTLPRMASWPLREGNPEQLWRKDQGHTGKARAPVGVGEGSISAA